VAGSPDRLPPSPRPVATRPSGNRGIDNIDNFRYDPASQAHDSSNNDRPVFARAPVAPDPLLTLPTPTTSNGVDNVLVYPKYIGGGAWDTTTFTTPQDFNIGNSDDVTFPQGIYGNVNITGGTATLVPGIYSSLTTEWNSHSQFGHLRLNASNLNKGSIQSRR
jgi:hypothetical protein